MEYSWEAVTSWKEMDRDMIDQCEVFHGTFEHYKSKKGIKFYFPNYADAPWQVQCKINDTVINFWPHKGKAHVEYTPGPAVKGIGCVQELIEHAISGTDDEEFDVFE